MEVPIWEDKDEKALFARQKCGFLSGYLVCFILVDTYYNNRMSAIVLVLLFSIGVVTLIFVHRGLPGSARDIGWKMSGVWSNPRNLRVMLHSTGGMLRGHVVSPGAHDHPDGALVIKELHVRPLWRWSDGTFVEPGSRQEHHVRLRLKGTRTISVKFLPENKTEEWKLIDPM
jgi:hypothetical protein